MILAFMLGVIFFLLGMGLAKPLTDVTNEARNPDGLDCANVSLSNQDKANCTAVDTIPPVFIGIVFGLAGLILARMVS